MLVMTDAPATFASLAPAPLSWERRPVARLSGEDGKLWRELGGGPELYVLESPTWAEPDFWRRIFLIDKAPASQFDVLRELLAERAGISGPVACLARSGSGFHGHQGRPWEIRAGNLHLSVAFKPRLAARHGLDMTMLPAVAVVDAVRQASHADVKAGIKWVNDILLDGRKIGGVLTAAQAQGGRLTTAVFGIGLNVSTTPAVSPTPFVPAVGCLSEIAGRKDLTLPRILTAVLAALADRYRELLAVGSPPLLQAYRDASLVLGRRVHIWPEDLIDDVAPDDWPPPLISGIVRSVEPDLSLRLADKAEPVSRGRLAFAEECPAVG